MQLLPIVGRELRVASRKPGTYWLRFFAALAVVLIFLFALFGNSHGSPANVAREMFDIMSGLALFACLFAGAFQTADCLSSEKREGTLGLLFLTDLKGYDVVLGKLVSNSVPSQYGLLSILPVLALPLLMGGVSNGEFWRMVLVLLVTLFFSLSVGMIVSAISRETRQAMMITVGIVIFLTAILPAIRASLRLLWPGANLELTPFLWLSTGYAYSRSADAYYTYRSGSGEFWGSILTISTLAFACLLLAIFILPRAWQEKAQAGSGRKGGGIWRRLRFGSFEYRRWIRASLLEANPFHWLMMRDGLPRISARMLLGVVLPLWLIFIFCAVRAFSKSASPTTASMLPAVFLIYLTLGCSLLFKCLVAIEASRRLNEDRQSGALELLLVTPLSIGQILTGQNRALWKQFRVTLFIIFLFFPILIWVMNLQNRHDPMDSVIFLGNMVVLLTDFCALGWVGMWAGLRGRQHHRAVLVTLARILVLPWLLFVLMIVSGILNGSQTHTVFTFLLWFVAGVFNDFLWAKWARNNLRKQFRPCVASILEKQSRIPTIAPLKPATA
jgi:ABC-type transport system involved in cytochrome c biogenesis permease component